MVSVVSRVVQKEETGGKIIMLVIDVWTLFIALLVTALLQEFLIKPGVEIIKKYYHKSKKMIKDQVNSWPTNEK